MLQLMIATIISAWACSAHKMIARAFFGHVAAALRSSCIALGEGLQQYQLQQILDNKELNTGSPVVLVVDFLLPVASFWLNQPLIATLSSCVRPDGFFKRYAVLEYV